MTEHIQDESETPDSIWPKVLSGYAILFAGLAPAAIATIGLVNGALSLQAVGNVVLGAAIVYSGTRVFSGDHSQAKVFGLLVGLSYFGLAFGNFWYWNDFPAESRAARMALPRMIRGILFGSVYVGYFSNLSHTKKHPAFKDSATDDIPIAQYVVSKTSNEDPSPNRPPNTG